MMTNVSYAPNTIWLILTLATEEDAWGQCKNSYLAKRREVPAWCMEQHVRHEAGVLWPPSSTGAQGSMLHWG